MDTLPRLLELATENGLLHALPSNVVKSQVSLYADIVVIFLAPDAHDIGNLNTLLQNFGEATGLRTNVAKSSVVAIRCAGIDLDDTLADFHAIQTQFPMKYLGLPLSLGRTRRVDL